MLVVFVLHCTFSVSAQQIATIPQSRLRRASSLYTREPFGKCKKRSLFLHRQRKLHENTYAHSVFIGIEKLAVQRRSDMVFIR